MVVNNLLALNSKFWINIFHPRFLQKVVLIHVCLIIGSRRRRTLCPKALPPPQGMRSGLTPSAAGLQASLTRGRLPGGRRTVACNGPVRCCRVIVCGIWKIQGCIWGIPVLHAEADPGEVILREALRLKVRARLDPGLLVDPRRVRDVVYQAEDGARL